MHGPKHSPLSEPLASNTSLTMPSRTLLALTTAALLGLIIGGTYAPATAMSFENYPRLTDSEFALFQADAESFAEVTCPLSQGH